MNAETKIELCDFVRECEVVIDQLAPGLDYRKPDLYGFVAGCWPTNDDPATVAGDFVNSLEDETEV